MFTLTSFSSPFRSSTMRSSTGETAWHGPHHSAQKSTITGLSLWSTSSSKLCSVTAVAINSFLTDSSVVPLCKRLESPGCSVHRIEADVPTLAAVPGSPGPREGGSRVVGPGADLRAAEGAEPRRPEVQLHGRPDHGEQPDGRPSRVGPDPEGRLPALQGPTRVRPALPERLRLAGALGRGRRREVTRARLETRDRGVRARPVRRALQGTRRPLRRGDHRPDVAPRHVDGLG